MRPSPLRRRRLWRRQPTGPREDRVTDELMNLLWRRDGGCVLAQKEPGHRCRDRFGNWVRFNDRTPGIITPEHFYPDYAVKGDRAPSDLSHTVLLCAFTNINAPSKDQRNVFRAWVLEKNR